jgi:hypothetical protein
MLQIELKDNRIFVGKCFSIGFQRTLVVPDDGCIYPLPPGLGLFPIHRVADYKGRLAESWNEPHSYFVSLYQREALWLGFGGLPWKPNAVKVGVGGINAVSGEPWSQALTEHPQNYLVVPKQPWLDGINAGAGYVRQFVAMPLGVGYTVEGQITGTEALGGIQILVFDSKPGRFPEQPPLSPSKSSPRSFTPAVGEQLGPEMGLAAGGMMKQKIYPDPYGVETWDPDARGSVVVHIVNTQQYSQLTGAPPPPTPISAETYIERGYPWFDLYDEDEKDVTRADSLSKIKSITQLESNATLDGERPENATVAAAKVRKTPSG